MRFTKAQLKEAQDKAAAKAVRRSKLRSVLNFIIGGAVGAAAMGSYLRPDVPRGLYEKVQQKVADGSFRVEHKDSAPVAGVYRYTPNNEGGYNVSKLGDNPTTVPSQDIMELNGWRRVDPDKDGHIRVTVRLPGADATTQPSTLSTTQPVN